MTTLLVIVHVVVCVALIMIVLLQTGKGADMGAAFGAGSSQTLFGASGGSSFLGKATTAAAIVFMLTSLGLAYLSTHRTGASSIMPDQAPVTAPAPTGESTAPADSNEPATPAATSTDAPPAAPADNK